MPFVLTSRSPPPAPRSKPSPINHPRSVPAPRSLLPAPSPQLLAPSSSLQAINHHRSAIHRLRLATAGRLPGFAKAAFLKLREFDAGSRALPEFLVIGAQKGGSTSLFNTLCTHPRIIGSVPKEIFFFDTHFAKGERWYRRHFPRRSTLARRHALCGEGSTTYLTAPAAPARAAELVPQAKLIALLREPAARAVSHYHHRVRAGRESRPIDAVFSIETIARFAAAEPLDPADALYFERSHYPPALARWRDHFPPERLLILPAESFFADPAETLAAVCTFLGLPPHDFGPPRADNPTGKGKYRPEAFEALKAACAARGA